MNNEAYADANTLLGSLSSSDREFFLLGSSTLSLSDVAVPKLETIVTGVTRLS